MKHTEKRMDSAHRKVSGSGKIYKPRPQALMKILLAVYLITFSACGFVTAPVAHGSAWLAGSTVKAAEAGRKQSIRAAAYVRDQALTGSSAPNRRQPGPPRH